MRGLVVVMGLWCAVATGALAQQRGRVDTLLRAARAELDVQNGDAAEPLLRQALGAAPSPAEMVRAWYLLGIAAMTKERPDSALAGEAFRQALRREPRLQIDSLLAVFGEDVARQFRLAGQAMALGPGAVVVRPAGERLTVSVAAPDTVLAATGEVLPLTLRPSRRARAIITVTPADAPGVLVWADTLPVGASGALGWDLRGRDGAIVADGRYAVHVTAVDSAGEESAPQQRVLGVRRVPADTVVLPAPLTAAAFRPETLHVRKGTLRSVLLGGALGAAVALGPAALGRPELNGSGQSKDGTAYVAASAVALAGIVGFVAGEQVRYAPENVQYNEELRVSDAAERRRLEAGNTAARERAAVRVWVEASP